MEVLPNDGGVIKIIFYGKINQLYSKTKIKIYKYSSVIFEITHLKNDYD